MVCVTFLPRSSLLNYIQFGWNVYSAEDTIGVLNDETVSLSLRINGQTSVHVHAWFNSSPCVSELVVTKRM